jgi:hypothetical protein
VQLGSRADGFQRNARAGEALFTGRRPSMRVNSGQGDSTNNNLDPTLRDHEGKKGPAQRSANFDQKDDEEGRPKPPSDSRQGRKDK